MARESVLKVICFYLRSENEEELPGQRRCGRIGRKRGSLLQKGKQNLRKVLVLRGCMVTSRIEEFQYGCIKRKEGRKEGGKVGGEEGWGEMS